jgi:hypothetical protein
MSRGGTPPWRRDSKKPASGKPGAVQTRKTALFAGHDAGGKTWGRIASLIETAWIDDVAPFAGLEATLEAIARGHPKSCDDDLLPLDLPAVKLKSPWGVAGSDVLRQGDRTCRSVRRCEPPACQRRIGVGTRSGTLVNKL